MRIVLFLTILLSSFYSNAQILIDDVGDDWRYKVNCALDTIKKYDNHRFQTINLYCKRITFWGNNFSTTEDEKTIMISSKEMLDGNIYNISAIIVHETYHLMNYHENLDENFEESLAYIWEYEYLIKIPNVDFWLIENAKKQNEKYKGLILQSER